MNQFQHDTQLATSFKALEKDLLRDGGAQISTTRNYNFAILPYEPDQEFQARRHVNALSSKLRETGWVTGTVALQTLLLERLRRLGPEYIQALIDREKRLYERDPARAINHLTEKVVQEIEGPDGLAADVIAEIKKILDAHPDSHDKLVIFLARAGALYPFLRTSALLKHVADHTDNVPVILLYPGHSDGETGLSFMGKLLPDRDYRPRIYR